MIQGIARDITRQTEYEKALRESEQKYRSLIETLPYGIAIIQDERLVFANAALLKMLKAKQEDVIGRNVLEAVAEEDRDTVHRYGTARQAGHTENIPDHYTITMKRLDGEKFAAEIYARRIEYEEKPAVQLVGIDISPRLANQAERARLASAVEQAAECIMITDPEGRVQYVNPCFTKMTGYSPDEVIGRTPAVISSDKHSSEFYEQLWNTISSGKTWRGHFVNQKKDGSLFEEEAVISPVTDDSGRIVNYVAVKRNVTYEHILENQIRHSQKMAAMGHLAHRITHNYTNALTRIIGNAQIAQAKAGESSGINQHVQEVIDAANEVASLAAELLAFAHPSPPKMRKVSLNRLIDGLEEILGRTLSPEINLVLEPASGKHKVNADPTQIEQALTHMALNSMEAMPEGGTLTITTMVEKLSPEEIAAIQAGIPESRRHRGGFGAIVISDSGRGMSQDVQAHAFEPFYTTKEGDKGAGLGLSTAERIISQHGGQITISSTPGAGTSIKVYLPLADE
jgi:PAS domain S-box-containing protein